MPERRRQTACARRLMSATSSPRSKAGQSIFMRTSTAGAGRWRTLIKLHKAQLASDRMSCHSATANQVRLALHTAAYWLMLAVRDAIPQTEPLAKAEFATIRE